MTPRRLLFVPLCFLASVHASAQQRDTTAQLAGVVFSAYTGRPLVGATVRSETRETITDSLGRFTLGPLPAGTLKVVFGYGEHVANTLTATLPLYIHALVGKVLIWRR